MTIAVLLSTPAQKQFEGLDRTTKGRIRLALRKLSTITERERTRFDIKKLKGVKGREDLYRLRVGVYRIIYFEDKTSIKVLQILHRRDAFNWL